MFGKEDAITDNECCPDFFPDYQASGIGVSASIPSRDVLLGRLLGSMQSPITNFARVLNQIAEKNGEGAEAPAEA